MAISTRLEIRNNVITTAKQNVTQIGTLVEDFINITLHEIESPGWAFSPRREINHRWSWLKRKTSFVTVADIAEYVLSRNIQNIALMRQTVSPFKLVRMIDEDFYRLEPNPTATGNPTTYRTWEVSGVATKLATADTIDIVSSSADDDDDNGLTVTVWGYTGGILQSESYTLDGTTLVAGTTTFDADDLFVFKSKDTAGTITITAGATTLTTLGKEDRAPLHKVVSLYPIPSSVMTIYVEYYENIRELTNDGDVPQFGANWHYVVRMGTLAKVYQYLGKDADMALTQSMYSASLRAMVNADMGTSDLSQRLRRHYPFTSNDWVRRDSDDIA